MESGVSNPALLAASLDGSLAYTDLVGSGTLTGVDPIRYDGGLWTEEGGTNYCPDPLGLYGTPGYSVAVTGGAAALGAFSTELGLVGAQSWRTEITTKAAASNTIQVSTPTASGLSLPAGTPISCAVTIAHNRATSVYLQIRLGTSAGNKWVAGGLHSVSSASTRIELNTITEEVTTMSIRIEVVLNYSGLQTAQVGDVAHCWYPQYELLPYATSLIPLADGSGAPLAGYAFTSTAHNSPSNRHASSAAIDPTGILAPGSGALAFRITPTIETGLEEIWGECGVKGAGTDHLRWGRDASKHPFCEWSSNDAAYQRLTASETLTAGTAYDVYLGHTGTVTSLAVDAGTLQTGTRAAVSGDFSTGDLTLEASAGGVIYQLFATFSRTLTAKEIATLNGKNNWTMNVLAGNPYINFQLRPY